MATIPVIMLEPVRLWQVKVNRGDSGSPQWKDFFLTTQTEADTFLDAELPDNRLGRPVPAEALRNRLTGEHYMVVRKA